MGERVNIQYSVDIGDLGKEVARLIGEAYSSLHTVTLDQVPDKDNVLSLRTIQMISEVRQKLADIDSGLSDAVNIINGYVSYKSHSIAQQEIATAADREHQENTEHANNFQEDESLNSLLGLQNKIKQFQNESVDS
tara:strand:- start:108 stop:515 length:408 start_codon:yes stop_codon:yes gene_type:complete